MQWRLAKLRDYGREEKKKKGLQVGRQSVKPKGQRKRSKKLLESLNWPL